MTAQKLEAAPLARCAIARSAAPPARDQREVHAFQWAALRLSACAGRRKPRAWGQRQAGGQYFATPPGQGLARVDAVRKVRKGRVVRLPRWRDMPGRRPDGHRDHAAMRGQTAQAPVLTPTLAQAL